MNIESILRTVREYLPIPVIVSVVAVIMLVYVSLYIAQSIEEYIETKKGKQIKLFEHKKIWLSFFWCILFTVLLALGGFILWKEAGYYMFIILGGSTFLYEAFLKKTGIKKDD
ncbi:MAG: hypothetical protein J6S85_01670 [Methanobrevibacter sp.]|nr:hypothetical protein [Methanobrevibacter sp.]MBO7712243.1 hypothetical protein [Methanobrevibacter sp.]